MRGKLPIRWLLAAVLVATLGVCVTWRIADVNARWPQPETHTALPSEPLTINGLTITLTGARLIDGSQIPEVLNGYTPTSEDRIGTVKLMLVDITLRNETTEPMGSETLDSILFFSLWSGPWYNGVDLGGIQAANPAGRPSNIPAGEEARLSLPYNLYDHQFEQAEWDTVDERSFTLSLMTYPDKYELRLPDVGR
ncbi:hypothetical protein GCM10009785_32180 [Brooklawnia cerclae]|uniref:DUF4352 domain-containing protein n=1 Tax=Brooklawnia cerclae TaxID=349934 RepID=A0ABX0SEU7_9ACTN|nr:hypothetical protein [Brooklawnia cerclae]NIH56491.1 hypothetical protein [Brooklawnia cerclae]